MSEQYLNRKAAANFLTEIGCPITATRLAFYAMEGNARSGPPFIKIKKSIVRYAKTDLEKWARENTKRVE